VFLIDHVIDAIGDSFHFMSQNFQLRGRMDIERAYEIIKAASTYTRMYRRK